MSSSLEEWGKTLSDMWNGALGFWKSLGLPALGAPAETKVGQGPLTLQGTLRNPDGSPIANAKLTLKTKDIGTFLGTGTSSPEGKYCFVGVPTTNLTLEVEEPGKIKRTGYVDIRSRIYQGVVIREGLVMPIDVTVPYPEAPSVTYKVIPPPSPEYKPPVYPPYMGVAPTKPKQIYA